MSVEASGNQTGVRSSQTIGQSFHMCQVSLLGTAEQEFRDCSNVCDDGHKIRVSIVCLLSYLMFLTQMSTLYQTRVNTTAQRSFHKCA